MTKKVSSPTSKLAANIFIQRPPKKTAQGDGLHSRANHGRKPSRGQGR
jgi:hypothetical protein